MRNWQRWGSGFPKMPGKTVYMVPGINPSGGKTASRYMVLCSMYLLAVSCFTVLLIQCRMLFIRCFFTRQAFLMFEYSGLSCVFFNGTP